MLYLELRLWTENLTVDFHVISRWYHRYWVLSCKMFEILYHIVLFGQKFFDNIYHQIAKLPNAQWFERKQKVLAISFCRKIFNLLTALLIAEMSKTKGREVFDRQKITIIKKSIIDAICCHALHNLAHCGL